MKKNKNINVKRNRIIALIIAISIVIIVTTIIICAVKPSEEATKYSQYKQVQDIVDNYNQSHAGFKSDVSLVDNDTDLIVMISNFVETEDGNKHISMINYTKKQINTTLYDKDNNPLMIANMQIDENYNVSNVVTYVYSTGDINSYNSEDEEIIEFKNIAATASSYFKEVFNSNKDLRLFGSTLLDLKSAEYKK